MCLLDILLPPVPSKLRTKSATRVMRASVNSHGVKFSDQQVVGYAEGDDIYRSNEKPYVVLFLKRSDYVCPVHRVSMSPKLFMKLQDKGLQEFIQLFKLDGKAAQKLADLFDSGQPVYQSLMTRDAGTESATVYANNTDDLDLDFEDQQELEWSFNEGNFPEHGDLNGDATEEISLEELLRTLLSEAKNKAAAKFQSALGQHLIDLVRTQNDRIVMEKTVSLSGETIFEMMDKALLV